jgi:hypothetical protein
VPLAQEQIRAQTRFLGRRLTIEALERQAPDGAAALKGA